ncbi:D,D-heptose 1,7-bisphosphate phosphatase [Campylobacterota bacterium]|nr:D,D-heptose 1,7-bisphosphate phosphatase [Campylobacterota bacterium]
MNLALFLDRDGVINVDYNFVHRAEEFVLTDGIVDLLRLAAARNYKAIVVTNQSGIARKIYTMNDFLTLTRYMIAKLEALGAPIAGVYYCPHAPEDGCECRKPQPGMLLQAAHDFQIDLGASWLIGDRPSDIMAAKNAGVPHTILLGEPPSEAEFTAQNIFGTIDIFKKRA